MAYLALSCSANSDVVGRRIGVAMRRPKQAATGGLTIAI